MGNVLAHGRRSELTKLVLLAIFVVVKITQFFLTRVNSHSTNNLHAWQQCLSTFPTFQFIPRELYSPKKFRKPENHNMIAATAKRCSLHFFTTSSHSVLFLAVCFKDINVYDHWPLTNFSHLKLFDIYRQGFERGNLDSKNGKWTQLSRKVRIDFSILKVDLQYS